MTKSTLSGKGKCYFYESKMKELDIAVAFIFYAKTKDTLIIN